MLQKNLCKSVIALVLCSTAIASDAINHAPIGVMGDHTHNKGEYMVSYRYMKMSMKDIYRGDDKQRDSNYAGMIKPREMNMTMHMLGSMYGVSDDVTLMLMLNYMSNDMDLYRTMGSEDFTTKTSGLGDTKFGALYNIIKSDEINLILNTVLSIPTGSITEEDEVPNMGTTQLPYGMQLGSGTFDITLGTTYSRYLLDSKLNLGGQFLYTFRTGENDQGYNLGDQYELNAWVAYALSSAISFSVRFNELNKQEISDDANDLKISSSMNPLADIENYGGKMQMYFLGVNYISHSGVLANHRLALEYGKHLNRNLNGFQMGLEDTLMLGWQLAF